MWIPIFVYGLQKDGIHHAQDKCRVCAQLCNLMIHSVEPESLAR